MSLSPGSKLGHYAILEPLGRGGMGEVYKASDTRLDRTVAIKVLPAHLAESPERKGRFEREARAISQLNHPRICTLYDVGREDGVDYLVMEHIEGETLSERLKRGALPFDQALECGIQIAGGLHAAHRAGIVHRDLKPANVMLTKSGVKLLDFGLAKHVGEPTAAGSNTSSAPTQQKDLTAEETLVGTLQYMAPEQLEAGEVDARTDIFAVGLVLYEMVTGQKAFQGKSQASLIAAILEHEPSPLTEQQSLAPPLLERVVASCLAKDPDDRWQSAADVKRQLEWILDGAADATVTSASNRRAFLGWAVAGLLLLGFLALRFFRSPSLDEAVVRFIVEPPEGVAPNSPPDLALSPDGRRLAIAAIDESTTNRLWIRSLGTLEAREVPGTEGARRPFWSPDGREIGFLADGKLKIVDLEGGPTQTISDAWQGAGRLGGGGAAWSPSGDVLVVTERHELHLVPASGGELKPVVTRDNTRDTIWDPEFLPDGRRFLYSVSTEDGQTDIFVGSVDSELEEHVMSARSKAIYSPPGFLLFLHENALMAQPFDADTAKLSGTARVLAEVTPRVRTAVAARFTASGNGVLSYFDGYRQSRLLWFDRDGKRLGDAVPEGWYNHIEISPDDALVAVDDNSDGSLWLGDLSRGVVSRLTFDNSASNWIPMWSPDSSSVGYVSFRTGRDTQLYLTNASGDGSEELIFESDADIHHTHWSPDGESIVYERFGEGDVDLWVLPVTGEGEPWPYLQSDYSEQNPQFSPDGRWMAYSSDESGQLELYVRSFPEGSGRRQISTSGGDQPRWRADGKELFYLALDGTLMAVPTNGEGDTFEVGRPETLFQAGVNPRTGGGFRGYDVTNDGERFLFRVQETSAPVTVVLNWTALLED